MQIVNGKFMYDTIPELTYALLNEMELSTTKDGTIVDKTIDPKGTVIMVSDKRLKANTDDRNIKYAGDGDFMLDPLSNLHILNTLFGLYLDKLRVYEGVEITSFFYEETPGEDNQNMCAHTLKYQDGTSVTSEFYYNRCLGLIELIFLISGDEVSLRNFDITPKQMKKIKKEAEKKAIAEKEALAAARLPLKREGM